MEKKKSKSRISVLEPREGPNDKGKVVDLNAYKDGREKRVQGFVPIFDEAVRECVHISPEGYVGIWCGFEPDGILMTQKQARELSSALLEALKQLES